MGRTRIKICGVARVEDALYAAEAGADAIGMILHAPGRKREIGLDQGREIALALPPFVTAVGVVVDLHPMRLRQLLSHVPLGLVQFHGKEGKDDVLSAQPTRATKVLSADETLFERWDLWRDLAVPNLRGLVIDSPGGGTGVAADWSKLRDLFADPHADALPLTLAGGLTPENVGEAVRTLHPWAVDVSSGVEEPGRTARKSRARIAEFVAAVREADAAIPS